VADVPNRLKEVEKPAAGSDHSASAGEASKQNAPGATNEQFNKAKRACGDTASACLAPIDIKGSDAYFDKKDADEAAAARAARAKGAPAETPAAPKKAPAPGGVDAILKSKELSPKEDAEFNKIVPPASQAQEDRNVLMWKKLAPAETPAAPKGAPAETTAPKKAPAPGGVDAILKSKELSPKEDAEFNKIVPPASQAQEDRDALMWKKLGFSY
jgi:hypothetical protein